MKKIICRKKWIKICDELPKQDCDCIIWGKKIGMHGGTFSVLRGRFYYIEDGMEADTFLFTHFHQFPNEPRERSR
jgi:hypothetical protein